MYINNSLRITEPRFDIEPAPTPGDEIRIFIFSRDFGHISVYLSLEEVESLAFQLSTTVQDIVTSRENSND